MVNRNIGDVLIVDDDEFVRGALSALFSLHGYRVQEAPDGAVALESLRSGYRPTAILYCVVGVVLTVLMTMQWRAHLWQRSAPVNSR